MSGGELRLSLPDFLQNVFSAPINEILTTAQSMPGRILARREHFFEEMSRSWVMNAASDLPVAPDAELRPLYGRGLVTSGGRMSSYYANSAKRGRIGREVKALLLYADSIVVINPLAPWVEVASGHLKTSPPPAGNEFLDALVAVCELAELIRSNVVLVADPPEVVWNEELNISAALARFVANRTESDPPMIDQMDQYTLAQDALLRLLTYSAFDPSDESGSFSSGSLLEGDGISRLIGALSADLDPSRPLPTEAARLRSILQLSLPGVDGLETVDMIAVRSEAKFVTFRSDMRTALGASNDFSSETERIVARRDITEFMAARAEELKSSAIKRRFWDATSGAAIGMAVGASVTPLDNWKAALIGLLARGLFDTVRTAPATAAGALRRHYVALSQNEMTTAPEVSPAKRIAQWRQKNRGVGQ